MSSRFEMLSPRIIGTIGWALCLAAGLSTNVGQAQTLFSFESDDEPEWFATGIIDDFSDNDTEVEIVSGVGNTDGDNALQVVGRVGDYVRHAQVDFDFDQVEQMNEAIENEWNLEFDWSVVASENPGASRFWVQMAISHSAGWAQIDMFEPDWPEWDPNGPDLQTMHASIPLGEITELPGFCCGDQPPMDGFGTSYQFQMAVGSATEEGPVRSFYLDNFALVDPSAIVATPGDFDGNDSLDEADIDGLTAEVLAGTNDSKFDLNGDNVVDEADRSVWIQDLRRTYRGDANLDGMFDSGDLVQSVFARRVRGCHCR